MKAMSNFSQPQKQSLLGVVVMFADTLQRILRAFWPLLIVWIVKLDSLNKLLFFVGIAVVVVLIAIYSYLQYLFFTFYIDEETNEFIIQKGVFNRTKIAIQLHKIQQVNINQSLIQRLVGVYKLEIDTAGSDKKEASISAISHNLATILKEQLTHHSEIENAVFDENSSNEPTSILKINLLSLIKIGFTSNYVKSFALLFVFFTTIMENIRQLSDNEVINEDNVTSFFDRFSLYSNIALGIGVIISLVLIVNLVRTIIKYFNFTIQKNNQSVSLFYGLLATKNTLLNPNKVQKVIITQNFFQKKLDILTISVQQASSDAEMSKVLNKIEVPGCTQLESNEILKLLFNKLPEKGAVFVPNWRKLVVNLFFLLIVPVFIFFIINLKTSFLSWNEWFMYSAIFTLFAGILILFSYKNYKLFATNEYIFKQNGAWDIDSSIIEPFKIQAITTHQFIWQKATNIGSVTLYTAGGNISFSTANYIEIKKLVNYWLYQVETSTKNWM